PEHANQFSHLHQRRRTRDTTVQCRINHETEASTYRALDRLTAAGVLDVLSESKRNRVWAAVDVLAELDALSAAIGELTLSGDPRGNADLGGRWRSRDCDNLVGIRAPLSVQRTIHPVIAVR